MKNQNGHPWERLFTTGKVMHRAWKEQQACIADVYTRMAPCLETPAGTPDAYVVQGDSIPDSFYTWRKNMFSSLFHSVYILMDFPPAHRALYGRLIHLYRIWVTTADNLLDAEDKVVVPIRMPGQSRIMRQVVALMAADRVLAEILAEAVMAGILSEDKARALSRASLCHLLPSGAQEAMEEGGITVRPDPEHVLAVIHRLKTGLLFNLAFIAPEIVEDRYPAEPARVLKSALMDFGLGCQLLDDVRDLARDLLEHRHNYVLSWMVHNRPELLNRVETCAQSPEDRIYLQVPDAVLPAVRRGFAMMCGGLARLGELGLGCNPADSARMARVMFNVLDIEELCHA